jgi:hypothetical protein
VQLIVAIPNTAHFYSLYADGLYSGKAYDKAADMTYLYYDADSAVFLYYTYPTHRRVYLIRNTDENEYAVGLPGLSKKVSVIFKHYASRVDKTKRAVSCLNARYQNAYGYSDKFYARLSVLISKKGTLDYAAIDALCKKNWQ